MEDWPGKGDMLRFAGCHVHPSYSTQVGAPTALLNSGTLQYPGLASCYRAMASDPLSVTLTCVPCSGQSIVTLVLSFYLSPFYHVGSQVACSLCLSHLHPQPGLEATTRDDFTELLNANQLLLMLQVLQLLPVLSLLCTFRHPGHHPILKMSEAQDRRHQQSERDWGGRWVRWNEQRLGGAVGGETIIFICISTVPPPSQPASWLPNHLNAQRPASSCSKCSPSWLPRPCLWTSGRIPPPLLGSLLWGKNRFGGKDDTIGYNHLQFAQAHSPFCASAYGEHSRAQPRSLNPGVRCIIREVWILRKKDFSATWIGAARAWELYASAHMAARVVITHLLLSCLWKNLLPWPPAMPKPSEPFGSRDQVWTEVIGIKITQSHISNYLNKQSQSPFSQIV